MNQTILTFLQLAPALVSVIQSVEKAIPAPKSGPSKLNTFTNLVLGLFGTAGPLAAVGIEGPHDSATIIKLSKIFADSIVAGINITPDRPVEQITQLNNKIRTDESQRIIAKPINQVQYHDPTTPR